MPDKPVALTDLAVRLAFRIAAAVQSVPLDRLSELTDLVEDFARRAVGPGDPIDPGKR